MNGTTRNNPPRAPRLPSLSPDELDESPVAPACTILLVDDDPEIRSLTRTFLEHTGFRVFTSGDAHRALQIFLTTEQPSTDQRRTQRIDLLIADQYMPLRSGMELALELKQIRPELPVLLISGGILETAHLNQLSQPGWSFLPKPFSLPDLLSTVHRILMPASAGALADAESKSTVGESNTIS